MPRLRHFTVLTLGVGLLAGAGFIAWRTLPSGPRNSPPSRDESRVAWLFEPPVRGAIIASPCLAGDCVYVNAIADGIVPRGAVYCLNAADGQVRWKFDDDGEMLHSYSTPCVADNRLYVGEGMHANFVCKLRCLDAQTGRKLWEFAADGHIESSPCVVSGAVFFGAGDDGVYCLDAVTGARRWHLPGPWHVDASPAVVDGRLYAGSGGSRRRTWRGCLCIDASRGMVLWREATDLPAWGSPAVDGDQVYFGLGNGRLTEPPPPPEKPAGAVLCLETGTGKSRWRYSVAGAVFTRPTARGGHVFFGSADGACYCLDREGQLCWRRELGSPVLTSPALAGDRVYVAASGGKVYCLDAQTGEPAWTFDMARHAQREPFLLSSPAVSGGAGPRQLYLGGELRGPQSDGVLYCLRD
jgi:outer membrane protein assembly factor BamB